MATTDILQYETLPPLGNTDLATRAQRFARVLPLAFVTYSLAYLDRMNIQFGAAAGMKESLGFTDNQFALFNASFFWGYVLFQIPGTAYAAHRSCRKLIFWLLMCWGVLATLTGVLRDIRFLVADRILLGVVEGAVFPSLLVFLTHWFSRRERSRANVLLILGNPLTLFWASGVSGMLLTFFNTHRLFGREAWQLMFLAEGIPTLVWAVLWWFMAADYPSDVGWMDGSEASGLQKLIDDEQRHVTHIRNYWAAFADLRVWIFCFQFLAWSVGIYGLNSWMAVVIKHGSGLSIRATGFLSMVPYLFGMILMLGISFWSDRTLVRKTFVWPFMFLGAAAFGGSYLAGPNHFWWAFAGIVTASACMYAPYGPFWAMVPEMVSRNVAGESMALINTMGAAGGLVGTWFVGWLNYATHGPGAGFMCMGSALVLAGFLTLMLHARKPELAPRG